MELAVNQPLDLAASLLGGQAHRWKLEGEWFSGVIRGNYIKLRPIPGGLEFRSAPWPEAATLPLLQSHLRLDDDLFAIQKDICCDPRVAKMVARYSGLRVLRQDPWECLIAYIISANSNLARIQRNVETLAETFGHPIELDGGVRHSFPLPTELVEAGEAELRRLGLGFRAPYVDKTTRLVVEGKVNLSELIRLPYAEAKEKLLECPGIGPKVADCILVFSLEKLEAFPIDVWVRRALGEWYFPGDKTPPDRVLLAWAHEHFGRYAGYAQQYLFHGRRLEGREKAEEEAG